MASEASGGAPLLELRGVSVVYGKFQALSEVNYRVLPGQVVALLGGNASGKSTSMKTICGTTKVTSGDIYWHGQKVTGDDTPTRMARGIGVVPEGRRVFATLTVEENLKLGIWSGGGDIDEQAAIGEMLELFPPMKKLLHRPAGVLSGGEQQMVAFARALIKRPELVLMDEPSMGLAPALVNRCFEIIEQVRETGVSIFVVEQNARAALKIADYAYVLSSGSVALEGTPDVVENDPVMAEAYLGKKAV
ncbi:ABC transporter ATP-binding protein [Nocardioides hungaricus]